MVLVLVMDTFSPRLICRGELEKGKEEAKGTLGTHSSKRTPRMTPGLL